MYKHFFRRIAIVVAALLISPLVMAAHGYALWGTMKYPPNFTHFDYVRADAPKGGHLRLVSNQRMSSFDKYNPFTVKGSAPAYLSSLMFDTLLTGALDETASAYGLLASDTAIAPDGRSVVFTLRREARFQNGKAVTAHDVLHTYQTLIGPHCSPAYQTLLAGVRAARVIDNQRIRFDFLAPNRELPLTLGALPIFSRDWGIDAATGAKKPFDQVILDTPIGSGPYRIGAVVFGKDIRYDLNPSYWARDLPVRRGTANFAQITVKIYKDNTARLEALKAGEFDLMRFFSARDWARLAKGGRFETGEIKKTEFEHRLPSGFQSFVLNTRRPLLQDIRVRQALGLAMDFEWMNRQMFFGAYRRVQGLFGNTACSATGVPSAAELALLNPWRGQLPSTVWGEVAQSPRTDGVQTAGLRGNLRQAQTLLKRAGWRLGQDGVLVNAQGEKLTLELLDSSEGSARVYTPWARNLQKLGIQLNFRAADYSLYQQRLQKFDFDIVSMAFGGTHNPGQEYADLFGSKAAKTEDSGNFAGVAHPAVDALIARMVGAKSQAELIPACRALDRVIGHGHYLIGQWYASTHRIAYDTQRLHLPPTTPPYAGGEEWLMDTGYAP